MEVSYEYGQKKRKRKGWKRNKGEEEKKEGRMMDRKRERNGQKEGRAIGRRKKEKGIPQCRCWLFPKAHVLMVWSPAMALLEMWASGRFLVQLVRALT